MTEKVTMVKGKKQRHRVEVFAIGPHATILAFSHGRGQMPELPGGGIDEGEDVVTAGLRETHEEAGWQVEAPKPLIIPGEWVYTVMGDSWLSREGWDEEKHFAMVCQALRFAPSPIYGCEGDDLKFKLLPFTQVFDDTASALEGRLHSNLRAVAEFRLAALRQLESLFKAKPEFLLW